MKILLCLFISLVVLTLTFEVQTKKMQIGKKDVKITDKTKKLYDRTRDPKNPQTKLNFIKICIHGFLDQLDLPKRVCEEKIREASTINLMNCMKVMKHVRKGIEKEEKLSQLKKFLNYPEIQERLKNKNYMKDSLKFLEKFFKG